MNANLATVTSGTVQQWPSTNDLRNLPERLNDQQLAMVTELAKAPLPPLPICDEGHFLKCLRTMLAVLPKRGSDELSGELLANAYRRMLGENPKGAISYMTERVLAERKWFPTISECIEILNDWRRDDDLVRAQSEARHKAAKERSRRLMEWKPPSDNQPLPPEELAQAERYLASIGINLNILETEK
jgi:hypothetical protein